MPFIRLKGLPGKVYVPDEEPAWAKKHNCRDCFSCQRCSDDRCSLCLAQKSGGHPSPLRPPAKPGAWLKGDMGWIRKKPFC